MAQPSQPHLVRGAARVTHCSLKSRMERGLAFGRAALNNALVTFKSTQAMESQARRQRRPRVIAIGASNLTRWLPMLVRAAAAQAAGPVEVVAVAGFGRSYGVRSSFFGRELPGIKSCGVWEALAQAERTPGLSEVSTGIVTDVGNDIFYGVEVETVLSWVEHAMSALRPQVNRLVLTGLPASVAFIGPTRFAIMRRLLVPSCRLQHGEGLRRAEEVNRGLAALAKKYDAVTFQGARGWYGWDRIHLKRRYWRPFIERLLGVERVGGQAPAPLPRLPRPGLRAAAPESAVIAARISASEGAAVADFLRGLF